MAGSRVEPLSVVVPAYREARRIGASVATIERVLAARGLEFEIVVVDDGSTDGTAEAAAAAGARVVRLPANRGKGAAVRAGVLAARGDWILVVDADLAIPLEELAALEPFADEAPLVVGSKRMPGSDVRRRRRRALASRLAQLLVHVLVVRGFRDTQCGFKLLRADVARRLFRVQRLAGYGYDFEVLYLARRWGIPVREVPVRGVDAGSLGLAAYFRTGLEALAVVGNRWRGAYPPAPPP